MGFDDSQSSSTVYEKVRITRLKVLSQRSQEGDWWKLLIFSLTVNLESLENQDENLVMILLNEFKIFSKF